MNEIATTPHPISTVPSLPCASVDLEAVRPDPRWTAILSAGDARRLKTVILSCVQGVVVAATSNRDIDRVRSILDQRLNNPLYLLEVDDASLRKTLVRIYGTPSLAVQQPAASSESIELLDEIEAAVALRAASDVHLIPGQQGAAVQLRVDGVLEDYRTISSEIYPAVVNRIKVLSGLDIAEKREPQDGRYATEDKGRKRRFDVRVATIPTRFGERVTLRFLSPLEAESLSCLGMQAADEQIFQTALMQPSGLILLTGPTGSGKSTTMLAAIEQIKRTRGGNVITVEDPIEYEIPGTTQVEVDSHHKTGFTEALRSILRHDPDVIVIGEIRDRETAELAIRASLTGHLVISTLHTNSAAGAVTRLIDMGVEPYLVAATLRLAVAQRLARRLCVHCRRSVALDSDLAEQLGVPELSGQAAFAENGCLVCAGKGFVGRVGLFELLGINERVRELIDASATEDRLQHAMIDQGRASLLQDGVAKVLAGTTTVGQVLAVVARG